MNIYHKLLFDYDEHSQIALLTVTAVSGSNPSRVGMHMILDRQGKVLEGSVGGGSIEEDAKKQAMDRMERDESGMIRVEITEPGGAASECIGQVDLFVQVFTQRDNLLLIGAGNVAHAIYRIAEMLDYETVIVDDRPDFANKDRFPAAKQILAGPFEETLVDLPINAKTNIIIATHGHAYDLMALRAVVRSDAKYVGMLSNRKKAKRIRETLAEEGVETLWLDKVYTPVGLSLGGTRPAEIAVSVMAEIQAVKYGKLHQFKNEKRDIE